MNISSYTDACRANAARSPYGINRKKWADDWEKLLACILHNRRTDVINRWSDNPSGRNSWRQQSKIILYFVVSQYYIACGHFIDWFKYLTAYQYKLKWKSHQKAT